MSTETERRFSAEVQERLADILTDTHLLAGPTRREVMKTIKATADQLGFQDLLLNYLKRHFNVEALDELGDSDVPAVLQFVIDVKRRMESKGRQRHRESAVAK